MVPSSSQSLSNAERALQVLIRATGGARSGPAFFEPLAQTLAEALSVHTVFIGVLNELTPDHMQLLTFWQKGQLHHGAPYRLDGTPCAQVIATGLCVYPDHVAEQFPDDPPLAQWGIHSYAGIRLNGVDGAPLGILTVLDTKPLAEVELVVSLLKLFAARTAAEIERARAQHKLQASEAQFRAMFDSDLVGMAITSADHSVFEVNARMCALLGCSREAMLATPPISLTHADDLEASSQLMHALNAGQIARFDTEKRYIRADGTTLHAHTSVRRETNPVTGEALTFVMIHDITPRKSAEARLVHLAYHDALTGLPNRTLFLTQLEHALADGRRHSERGFAVHFLDLDRFKDVNDSLGHPVGDALLVEVAQRLRGAVRGSDTVCRLGGDEFAILQTDLQTPLQASVLAEKILAELQHPFMVQGHQVHAPASIGIAPWSGEAVDAVTLMEYADIALYQAKDQRGRHAFHTPQLDADVRDRIRLGDDLRHALKTGEGLRVVFQPIVELHTRRMVAAETLVRWDHPSHGPIPPPRFVKLAEDRGVIALLSSFVLEQAALNAVRWREAMPSMGVTVNVSSVEFRAPGFVERVRTTLQETGLPGAALTIELTEGVMAHDLDIVAQRMSDLRADGISFAIDDFGTGFSSLLYLKRLPVSTLKVAQEFVRDMLNDTSDAEIVRATLSLAKALGLRVIAEGVELRAQEMALAAEGCELAQGYRYARPMPANQLALLLQTSSPLGSSSALPVLRFKPVTPKTRAK
jgi:diguanylate cyclase (GGDEF)-like protein/PAS domain S-box-containing protein